MFTMSLNFQVIQNNCITEIIKQSFKEISNEQIKQNLELKLKIVDLENEIELQKKKYFDCVQFRIQKSQEYSETIKKLNYRINELEKQLDDDMEISF